MFLALEGARCEPLWQDSTKGVTLGRVAVAGQPWVFVEPGCAHRHGAWGGCLVLFGVGDWRRLFTSDGLVVDFAGDAFLCASPQSRFSLDVVGVGHAVGHGGVQPAGLD